MAISQAKKQRRKLAQQGRISPEQLRGSWNGVQPATKTTPTLKSRLAKEHHKHKRNHALMDDDSFLFYRTEY
ncbi:hypothetical protein [Paenibacillus protaetiae]|uniref:YqkK n=1 Tax=Paenibacillus protaetiae TaxID=2509456 RepID=A0A4P6EY83_9BACL|nr:hypothetical protein [Paenibacillus protaetiae]QAY68034.1 hypothetical protein ET464_18330 [Paenibacillus protaetiae]